MKIDKKYNCTNNKFIIIFIFFILIIGLCYLYFYFNEKNTSVQSYLKKIFINTKLLKKKYPKLISEKYIIVKNDDIVYVEDFLDQKFFYDLQNIFNNKKYRTNNNILRKGNGENFINLHKNKEYNNILSLYYSEDLITEINKILNIYLQRLSLNDKNACSLLIYTNKGDYIDWHYDVSSLYGKRYTALLTLVNRNNLTNELSENEFIYKINGNVNKMKFKENSLVLFEGNKVLHKSTPINNNEKRIILSMVFCDICQQNNNLGLKVYDKIKDTIIYRN